MYIKKSFARVISALAIVVILASGMSNSVYAAANGTTAEMITGNAQILRASRENETKVNQAYEAIKKAAQTNNAIDIAYASELVESLSPTNRIRLFVRMARNYYYANYLDFSNKYFNAYAYLRANPDVAAKASTSDDPILYALEHYLDIGIYEGRSSQTSFDPVVAILVNPDCILAVAKTGELTPDIVREEFTKLTGNTTTEGYTVLWNAPVDNEGVYSAEPLSHSLYISRPEPQKGDTRENQELAQFIEGQGIINIPFSQTDIISRFADYQKYISERQKEDTKTSPDVAVIPSREESNPPSAGGNSGTGGSSTGGSSSSGGGYTPPFVPPVPENVPFINDEATNIEPYKLYFDVASASKQTGALTGVGPDKSGATVTYYGQTYKYIKNTSLSGTKDYTFMIYMCGSDQETNDSYARVSKQLISMLKAGELQNVNVVLCVGGSSYFQNDYMNGTSRAEDNIKNDGVGIYYLDGSKISTAYDNLSAKGKAFFDKDFVSMSYGTADTLSDAFKIINQDTFKKIAQVSSIDMGDPGLLSGFINLATELFPANNYGLSLSNHGGGLAAGVCLSASSAGITGTAITADELESALRATSLYSENKKLGTLFYDACLMSSSEIAYSLKDYYEYMLASEEVTLGETDYGTLLKAISDNCQLASAEDINKEITQKMLEAYSETSYHRGQNYYLETTTMSVFSSENIDKAITELNDAALLMQNALNDDDFKQKKIDQELLEATRKALLACADYDDASSKRRMAYSKALEAKNVVDLGEFIGYLIKNIDPIIAQLPISGEENRYIRNKLFEIEEKLLEACSDGQSLDGKSYIWKGVPIIENGSVTEEYKKLRGEDVNTSGLSVVLPGSDTLGNKYASYFNYEGSPLKGYYDFIGKYYEYIDEDSRKEKIASLTSELESADYTKLLMPVKDDTDGVVQSLSPSRDSADSSYISFKVAESYEEAGLVAPAHSFGSPMQDILETAYAIDISVVHQEKYDIQGETGDPTAPVGVVGTLKVDMLCGEATVDPNSVSFDTGTVNFSVNNLDKVVTGYKLSGEAASGTEAHGDRWQYVLSSEYEKDPVKKMEILTKLSVANGTSSSSYLIVDGTAKTEGETLENVQHVFYKPGVGLDYKYSGTVVVTTSVSGEKEYSEYGVEDIKEISAYHYVLVNEGDDRNPKYVRKCLEIDYADYGISSGYYTVTEDELPTISVVKITQTVAGVEDSIDNNGYVLSIRNDSTDTASSYSDIAKLDKEKYDSAKDSGNGLLVVNEEGTDGSRLEDAPGLTVSDETSHENDEDDGNSLAPASSSGSNLTSNGKDIDLDSTDEQQIAPVEESSADTEINATGEAEQENVISQTNPYVIDGVDVSEYAAELVEDNTMYSGTAQEVDPENAPNTSDSEDNVKATSQTEEAVVNDDNIVEMSAPVEDGSAA